MQQEEGLAHQEGTVAQHEGGQSQQESEREQPETEQPECEGPGSQAVASPPSSRSHTPPVEGQEDVTAVPVSLNII